MLVLPAQPAHPEGARDATYATHDATRATHATHDATHARQDDRYGR